MSQFVEEILHRVGDKLTALGYKASRKAEKMHRARRIREYHASRGPVGWVTGGYYETVAGFRVRVVPNTTGWFDGLPWVIVNARGNKTYTVDDWGRAYEDGPTNMDLSHPVLGE